MLPAVLKSCLEIKHKLQLPARLCLFDTEFFTAGFVVYNLDAAVRKYINSVNDALDIYLFIACIYFYRRYAAASSKRRLKGRFFDTARSPDVFHYFRKPCGTVFLFSGMS